MKSSRTDRKGGPGGIAGIGDLLVAGRCGPTKHQFPIHLVLGAAQLQHEYFLFCHGSLRDGDDIGARRWRKGEQGQVEVLVA